MSGMVLGANAASRGRVLTGRKFVRPGYDEAPPPPPVAREAPTVSDRKIPVRLTADQKAEMVELKRENPNLSLNDLALRYNVHSTTVRAILKKAEEEG